MPVMYLWRTDMQPISRVDSSDSLLLCSTGTVTPIRVIDILHQDIRTGVDVTLLAVTLLGWQ